MNINTRSTEICIFFVMILQYMHKPYMFIAKRAGGSEAGEMAVLVNLSTTLIQTQISQQLLRG